MLGLALLSGCGTGTSSANADCGRTVTVDQYRIPACVPLKLAVFLPGTNNADLQGRIQYLQQKIPGIPDATMKIFDAKFDATTQLNQIQDALQSHQFNAAIAAPVDGVLSRRGTHQAGALGRGAGGCGEPRAVRPDRQRGRRVARRRTRRWASWPSA